MLYEQMLTCSIISPQAMESSCYSPYSRPTAGKALGPLAMESSSCYRHRNGEKALGPLAMESSSCYRHRNGEKALGPLAVGESDI